MAQIKVYGVVEHLNPIKVKLSDVIHSCVVDVLSFLQDKRAHRFFALDAENFYYPASRTPRCTIVEISMFEGSSVETKKTSFAYRSREHRGNWFWSLLTSR